VVVYPDRRFQHMLCTPECGKRLRRRRHVQHHPRECAALDCCATFTPSRSDAVFCSSRCRLRAWRQARDAKGAGPEWAAT
jgi:hypothetical protein